MKIFSATVIVSSILSSWWTKAIFRAAASAALRISTTLSVEINLTRVLREKSAKNIHQGGFPGTIGTHECMNFAGVYCQRSFIQRQIPRETLGDFVELKVSVAHAENFSSRCRRRFSSAMNPMIRIPLMTKLVK